MLDTLFEEMKGRIKEDDSSVPIRDGDFLYWWSFKPGAQYRSWYRKPVGGGEAELIFDEPAEAQGGHYFRFGALQVSPDGKLLATLADYDGSERFQLRIRDLSTGKDTETVTDVRHRPAGVDVATAQGSSSPRSTITGGAIARAITGWARRRTRT